MQTDRNDNPGQGSWENRQENESRKMDRFGEDRDDTINSPKRNNESQDMRSDNDDFNDSGWERDNKSDNRENSRNAQSKTFEDEETWEEEQRMRSTTSNKGTENNDWNQNDPMQRSPGRNDHEERNVSSEDRYSDTNLNRYNKELNRRNSNEDELE